MGFAQGKKDVSLKKKSSAHNARASTILKPENVYNAQMDVRLVQRQAALNAFSRQFLSPDNVEFLTVRG